jgi:hypothetical protein
MWCEFLASGDQRIKRVLSYPLGSELYLCYQADTNETAQVYSEMMLNQIWPVSGINSG